MEALAHDIKSANVPYYAFISQLNNISLKLFACKFPIPTSENTTSITHMEEEDTFTLSGTIEVDRQLVWTQVEARADAFLFNYSGKPQETYINDPEAFLLKFMSNELLKPEILVPGSRKGRFKRQPVKFNYDFSTHTNDQRIWAFIPEYKVLVILIWGYNSFNLTICNENRFWKDHPPHRKVISLKEFLRQER